MNKNSNSGFTLIELFISILISSLVIMSVYSLYMVQLNIKKTQDQTVEIQQNIRSALFLLERDIRMAGYEGDTVNSDVGFTAADATGMTFTYVADYDSLDNDGDGSVDNSGEITTIQYSLTDNDGDGDLDLVRTVDGGLNLAASAIAENIEALEFYYTSLDNSGSEVESLTPSDPEQIKSVRVTILARSRKNSKKNIACHEYETPSGNIWGDDENYNERYYRKFLSGNIVCRNML